MWRKYRRRKLRSAPFPARWSQIIEAQVPFLIWLPEPDRRELEGHIQVFLAEKKFEGCGGLRITEEVRVCIAAQACLLLLHRNTDYYPSLRSVLVYPNTYFVQTTRHLSAGIVQETRRARLGEAWQNGAVVLSWEAVSKNVSNLGIGPNIVLHEFAHLLDYENGRSDGAPLLDSGGSRHARKHRYAAWTRVFNQEFENLRVKVRNGEEHFLSAYGATNPAEFFAVATETFFTCPHEMWKHHRELYDQLKGFFLQDPVQWTPAN
jgi:Mlc titration factor MtfA (ptsG expression regulator)